MRLSTTWKGATNDHIKFEAMKRQTALIFYVLGIYVVVQFAWWGFHLIELTKELDTIKQTISNRVFMIVGEGLVFLLILIFGLWRIQVSIKKDHLLSMRQNNFLLSVTHELKTPLASTKLYLQTLLKRNFEKEQRDELLHKALQENQRLEEIVETILTAARIENRAFKLHREKIDVNPFLIDLAEQFNAKNGKNWVQLELDRNFSLETDLFMFKTIVRNLLENACKYAADSPHALLKTELSEGNIKITVSDLGPGIPKEQQDAIFRKFVRIENEETRSQKGTGLGLYIASEFCKLLGGKLTYQTNKPHGSIFEINLTYYA